MLAMFDYPDPNVHADRRVETTTPLQKMFVLNSPFMVEQARRLAERLQNESLDDAQRIERAYRLLYSRSPTEEESRLGMTFLGNDGTPRSPPGESRVSATVERWQQYAHVLLAANELMYVD